MTPAACPDAATLENLRFGRVPEPQRTELIRHVAACPSCRQALQARRTEESIQENAPPQPVLMAIPVTAPPGRRLPFLEPSQHPDSLGRLGDYEVHAELGRGGMGVVLRAFDSSLNRPVAIKVLAQHLASSALARKRFLREARAAAAVRHPHVVAIHEVGEVQGQPFLVMQLVAGSSLQQLLDGKQPFSPQEIVRIGMEIAAGLAAAHAQGLIHRDVKPANILLEGEVGRIGNPSYGEPGVLATGGPVKITDFGLARAIDDAAGLTHSGTVAGTPAFMAPEQARGQAVDGRADLFSLGSVLYTLCTGQPPFRADSTMVLLRRVCEEEPIPIRQLNPEIPEWLERLIAWLMRKRAKQRPPSAAAVAELLSGYRMHLQKPAQVAAPGLPTQARSASDGTQARSACDGTRASRRWRSGFVWVATAAVVLLGALWWLTAGSTSREAWLSVSWDAAAGQRVELEKDGQAFGDHLENGFGTPLPPGSYTLTVHQGPEVVLRQQLDLAAGSRKAIYVPSPEEPAPPVPAPPPPEDKGPLPVDLQKVELAEEKGVVQVRPRTTLSGHVGLVWSVVAAPDGQELASAGADKHVRLWQRQGEAWVGGSSFLALSGEIRPLALSGTGKVLACGNAAGQIQLFTWDGKIWRKGALFKARDTICGLVFTRDGQKLFSAGGHWAANQPGEVRCWDVGGVQEIPMPDGNKAHGQSINCLALSPDESLLASGGSDRVVKVWDADKGQVVETLAAPEGEVMALAFSPDGTTLAAGAGKAIRIWKREQGVWQVRSFLGHKDRVLSLAFHPDGKLLASGGGDQVVKLWDLAGGRCLATLTGHGQRIDSLTFTPDGRTLASASWDSTVKLWDIVVSAQAVADGPFVLPALPGRLEQRYASLADAIQMAVPGDTIEIRGNGPFDCTRIVVRNKPLRIRAGAGSRPVLRLMPGSENQLDLLNSNAGLVLEGLELRRAGLRDPGVARAFGGRSITVSGKTLLMLNCRLVVEINGAALVASQCPLVEIQNTEILRPGPVASSLDWHSPAGGRLVIDNCGMIGDYGLVYLPLDPHKKTAIVELRHNTLLAANSALLLRMNPGMVPGPQACLRVDSEANLLASAGVLRCDLNLKRAGQSLTAEEGEKLLTQVAAWQERGSCYPLVPSLLLLSEQNKAMAPTRWRPAVADWEQIWSLKETQAEQGIPRFQGGDLLARLRADPNSLTPADFRLLPDSPGQATGVNVELLGPGPGFQRFQQTPEYEAWLKRVETALR